MTLNSQQEGPTLEGAVLIGVAGVGTAFCRTDQQKHRAAIAVDGFLICGRGVFVLLVLYDSLGR